MADSLQLPRDAPLQLHALGQPEQLFRSKTTILWWLGIAGFLSFLPAAMCFVFLVKPFGKNPPPPEFALGVGCLFSAAGLIFLFMAILVRLPVWIVFRSAVVELKGSKTEVFLWEEITELLQEVVPVPENFPGSPPIRYSLLAHDGRICEIEAGIIDRPALIARIAQGLRDRPDAASPAESRRNPRPVAPPILPRRTARGPISSHRVTFNGLTRRYAPQLLLGALALLLGLGYLAMSLFRPNAGALAPGIVLTALGLIGFLPILFWGFGGASEVSLLESGLRWVDARGEHQVTWDDIGHIRRQEMILNNTFRRTFLSLVLKNGTWVMFDHRFSDYTQLADEVQRRHTEVCLEPMRDELAAGRAMFGPIVVLPAGITLHDEPISWSDLQSHVVWNGQLLLKSKRQPKGTFSQIPLHEIPNVMTLLMLFEDQGRSAKDPALFFNE